MGKWKWTGGQSVTSAAATVQCPTCSENLPRAGVFKSGLIEHCDGRSMAFGAIRLDAHHVRMKHPRCWCCGADLGCVRCSGVERELLCAGAGGRDLAPPRMKDNVTGEPVRTSHNGRGPVWATKAAFLEHGFFQGQTLDDYPQAWHADYRRTADAARVGINDIHVLVETVAAQLEHKKASV